MKMYDYDRRHSTLDLKITAGQGAPLGQLTKLFVDGHQLGLISSKVSVPRDGRARRTA